MTDSGGKKRILIGAGSYTDAAAAIRLAERLASDLVAELGGLLVDDQAVSDASEMPGQRVVTSGGTLLRAPSQRRLAALLDADAQAFRAGLSGVAESGTLEWAFERRRGDLIAGVCEAARGWDLLLLGHRTGQRRFGRVIVVDHADAPSPGGAEMAGRIAAALRTEVSTVAVAQPKQKSGHPRPDLNIVLSERELLARVNRIHAALVVVDLAHGPLRGREQLRHLLEVSRCPVLVLNASLAEPAIACTTLIPEPPQNPAPDHVKGS